MSLSDEGGGDGPPAPEAAAPVLGTARCGNHPDHEAAVTCGRCGTFLCPDCVADFVAGTPLCHDCRPKVREVRALPWDETKSVVSFVRTFVRVVAHPIDTFAYMGSGPFPLGFAAIVFVLTFAPRAMQRLVDDTSVASGVGAGTDTATTVVLVSIALLVGALVGPLLLAALTAGPAWLASRSFRVNPTWSALVRVSGYAFPLFWFREISFLSGSIWLGVAAAVLVCIAIGFAFGIHARRQSGLDALRASIVGAVSGGTFLAFTVLGGLAA